MKVLLALVFVSFSLHAETFKIAGELVEFKDKEGLLLKGCEKKCEALKLIKKHKSIDLKAATHGMKFTNSIGSDVCSKVYKAQSLLGVTMEKDGRAFCFFKDKSMVEMNSLTAYLVKQKIIKK